MKTYFLRSAALGAFVLLGASLGSAQATPTQAFAPAKVAIVHSAMFADQKLGISRFLDVQKKINLEFKQTMDDLQKLKGQMDTVAKDLRTVPSNLLDEKAIGDKTDLYERLKREFNFRSGEADAAIGKRYQEMMKPVSDEISTMLANFAKKNGIDIVIDASKGGIYVFNNAPDITSQFVAYVNSQATTAKP